MRGARTIGGGLAALAIVALCASLWTRPETPKRPPVIAEAAPATMSPRPEAMAAPVIATPISPDERMASTTDTALHALHERLDRRERWRRTRTDDADARAALVAAARAGDDEAQLELANRLTVCPDTPITNPTANPANAPAEKPPDAFVELCAKWSGQTGAGERDWRSWRDRAAAAGNGLALMAQASDADALDADARRAALQQAWRTRDPGVADLVAALASGDRDYRGEQRVAGSPGFFFGNFLAQCRLGADCSRDSAAFQRWCRRGGTACDSAPSLDALFEQRLSPAQYGIARDQSAALAQAFAAAPEASAEGRALLRTIDRRPAPAAER